MENTDLNQEKLPEFYFFYSRYYYWTSEDAIALALGLNPKQFSPNNVSSEYNKVYRELHNIFEQAMLHDKDLELYMSKIKPMSFINWCNKMKINFPNKLEKLVKEFHVKRDEDLVTKYKNLEAKNYELEQKINELEKNLSTPNPKRTVTLHKVFIGLLALKYNREKIISKFGANAVAYNINNKSKISYAQIKDDLIRQGISIDDETISSLIKASIIYLEQN